MLLKQHAGQPLAATYHRLANKVCIISVRHQATLTWEAVSQIQPHAGLRSIVVGREAESGPMAGVAMGTVGRVLWPTVGRGVWGRRGEETGGGPRETTVGRQVGRGEGKRTRRRIEVAVTTGPWGKLATSGRRRRRRRRRRSSKASGAGRSDV